jgi:hypothetical protein
LRLKIDPGRKAREPAVSVGHSNQQSWRFELCPSPASQWGQSCSGTDYGYYRFRLVN